MADAEAIALRVFEEIRAAFPELRSTVDRHPAEVELAMDFDAQPGLLFDVHLNLQNSDELHLNAAALWVSWFPCTEPDVTRAYLDSVCGLLAGRYRILEHRRNQVTFHVMYRDNRAAPRKAETVCHARTHH